jgi:hypothetical protein
LAEAINLAVPEWEDYAARYRVCQCTRRSERFVLSKARVAALCAAPFPRPLGPSLGACAAVASAAAKQGETKQGLEPPPPAKRQRVA